MATAKSNSVSGIAVALGILSTGLITNFAYRQLVPLNSYVSVTLILIGTVGFFIEVEKELGNKKLGLDNSGVGLLLLAISFGLIQLAISRHTAWPRYLLGSLAVAVLMLGLAGTFDGLYKILKYIFAGGINLNSLLKTLGLLIPLASSILALLKQASIL